ncbi:hypothetical protein N7532_002300 [Penicillium argentinense]|uniref:Xylanolytic transcriptional activator regulatory domain-containing protein n=1 Tax=Penicillium argentinense TaxID=1131581 RepID=A0A9W9G113_9EURO|nr:uncharacterized protein N7532_002300 [Penicillium argentinense]KAJ5109655.1 hypothetical protein N7532_002300 [Penicillium argentinense]
MHLRFSATKQLPLRIAIDLLINRVDQLCDFISDNGLKAPPIPQDQDATLRQILDALGPAKSTSAEEQPTVGEKHALSPLASESILDTAAVEKVMGPPPIPANAPVPKTPSVASPNVEIRENATLQSPSLQSVTASNAPQRPEGSDRDFRGSSADTPDSILSNWDLDLAYGGTAASAPTDLQQLIESTSQPDALGIDLERISNIISTESDDGSTLVEDPSTTSDIEGLIDELSDRVGTLRIGRGGKTHFFGPTSTFNLKDMPHSDNFDSHRRVHGYSFHNPDRVDADKEVPPALEEHLINLYFSWQDPSFHVVDRTMYEEAKEKWFSMEDTSFYSEALRNAMCAIGSAFETRFHPTFVTFPKTLVDFFGDRARSLLESELDCPSVATVQAMVILSSHEIGNGMDSRGWLYSGMAIRLAFDLALHIDMSAHVCNGVISAADADLRRTVFWAAYIVDHQLGFHLGRPFRTNMDDVTVGKPIPSSITSYNWILYESPASLDHTSDGIDCTKLVSQQLVSLCEIMAPCGYVLYTTSKIDKTSMQEFNERIVAELCRWKAKLPPSIQIDINDHITPYLPHVLLLHMQYHQNIIYAHRPWMSKSYLQPQPPRGPGYLHARQMCIQSAIAIAKILALYETRYTLRRINVKAVSITSSAVLLLLFAAVSKYPSHSQPQIAAHLGTCFRALDEFALSWMNARRAKDLLVTLQHQWELRTHSGKIIRKAEGSWPPSKRSRLSGAPMSGVNQGPVFNSRGEVSADLLADAELDWMVMTDGDLLSETCDRDLFGWDPSSVIFERDHGPSSG